MLAEIQLGEHTVVRLSYETLKDIALIRDPDGGELVPVSTFRHLYEDQDLLIGTCWYTVFLADSKRKFYYLEAISGD